MGFPKDKNKISKASLDKVENYLEDDEDISSELKAVLEVEKEKPAESPTEESLEQIHQHTMSFKNLKTEAVTSDNMRDATEGVLVNTQKILESSLRLTQRTKMSKVALDLDKVETLEEKPDVEQLFQETLRLQKTLQSNLEYIKTLEATAGGALEHKKKRLKIYQIACILLIAMMGASFFYYKVGLTAQQQESVKGYFAEKLEQLKTALEIKEKEIKEKEVVLEQKEQKITQKEEVLGQKEEVLGQKEQKITQKEEVLGKKEQKITQKEEVLGKKEQKITQKEEEILKEKQKISEQEKLVESRKKILSRHLELEKKLEYLIEEANKFDNITLEVNINNISAINLYKKYGFKHIFL